MSGTPILHAEDDPTDRLLIRHAFERAAPSVRLLFAKDGQEAIDYLAGRGVFADRAAYPVPKLVLLDLKLPKKSGFEVLEWVRAEPGLKQLPVLVLTSSQESSDIERAYALGANSYLVKKVDVKAMREVVSGIGEYAELLAQGRPAQKALPS